MSALRRPRPHVLAIGLLLIGIAACSSVSIDVLYGKTDCYVFTGVDANVGTNVFSAKGIRVKAATPCPKIKTVRVEVFDDANGNGVRDPGETLFGQTSGQAAPASTEVITGNISCGKNTTKGGTTWVADIENENGEHTKHGGTF
jgi:hypothetical protein